MLSTALTAYAVLASPGAGSWSPHDAASGAMRYSVLGLFQNSTLTPTIATVTKHPSNPLFIQDRPWEPRLDNGYPNVVYTTGSEGDGPWRLWYGGIGDGGQYLYYANSTDGLHWEKPELGRYDVSVKWHKQPWAKQVGKKNNIVMFGGGLGMYLDLHEPNPALRYKISGGSPAGCYSDDGSSDCVVGTAGSPDGINHWTNVRKLSFPRPWRPDCHTNLFYDGPTERYYMTTRDYQHPRGREISMSQSGGGGRGGGGGGKFWKGNWTKMYTNQYPTMETSAGPMIKVQPNDVESAAEMCGQHCRATPNCHFFFVYSTGRSKGSCFPKASASGKLMTPACHPPACESAFYGCVRI